MVFFFYFYCRSGKFVFALKPHKTQIRFYYSEQDTQNINRAVTLIYFFLKHEAEYQEF